MLQWLRRFSTEDLGQDLIEYTLLIVFVTVAAACFVFAGRDSIAGIVGTTDNNLTKADAAASGGAAGGGGERGDR